MCRIRLFLNYYSDSVTLNRFFVENISSQRNEIKTLKAEMKVRSAICLFSIYDSAYM